jgi:uncharacterized membrane protein
MESRAKLLGHSIHQMLIPIPVGLYATAAVLDVVGLFVAAPELRLVSFWNLVIGSCGAVAAAVFGAIDLSAVPYRSRARRVGIQHAVVNTVAVTLFTTAILLRSQQPGLALDPLTLVLELAGFAALMVGGWLGGELVDRLGIGVDDGAHPDARSSLGSPAASRETDVAPPIAHPEHVGAAVPDTDPPSR